MCTLQVWHLADTPQNDKFQYTYFAHKINSFDTAPKNLLASDSRLRPDRYALEMGDLSKSGAEKSRFLFCLYLYLLCLAGKYVVLNTKLVICGTIWILIFFFFVSYSTLYFH